MQQLLGEMSFLVGQMKALQQVGGALVRNAAAAAAATIAGQEAGVQWGSTLYLRRSQLQQLRLYRC
jgi:hypothetical protein